MNGKVNATAAIKYQVFESYGMILKQAEIDGFWMKNF